MNLLLDLIRHADAMPTAPDGGDHERALSQIGQRQALLLAEHLHERGYHPRRVYCSTALRTRQTLQALGYDYMSIARFEPQIYDANLDTLLDLIARIQPLTSKAMIVGHNPGLQDLLLYLIGPQAPAMTTSSHVRLRLPTDPDRPLRGTGVLLDYRTPP